MLTEFARDHAFTIALFGLMAMVWFGWGQEDPPRTLRWPLAIGSVLGIALAGLFGFGVFARWDQGSALEGRFAWFGVLVTLEVVASGLGCLYLSRTRRGGWMAWWVALVVALHFIPLAILLGDVSLALLGLVQSAVLIVLVRRLRGSRRTTSSIVGPVVGATLLAFAAISLVVFWAAHGPPWSA